MMSLWKLFERSVQLYHKKTALIEVNRRISFDELWEISCRMGRRLWEEAEEKKQRRVLILARNSIEEIAVFLGCFQTGLIACPVNWRHSAKELEKLLADYPDAVLLSDRKSSELMRQAGAENVLLLEEMDSAWGSGCLKRKDRLDSDRETECLVKEAVLTYGEDKCYFGNGAGPEDIAVQLFTSGSTGTPKEVGHTHGGLMAYLYTYALESRWTAEEIYQTSANLFHLSGLSIILSLLIGSTTVFFDHFDSMEFLQVMEREKSSRVSMIPTLIIRLLQDKRTQEFDFSSVKKIVYGGSPMNEHVVLQAMERFHCQMEQAYGATESCCMAILLPEDHQRAADHVQDRKILRSAGRPLPLVQVRIRQETTGDEGKKEACGEIEVKSPFLCTWDAKKGQYGTADGYHPTGDMGWVDSDGYLYLAGRKHDLIISGGENVYPKEVEDCIAGLTAVEAVCVLGMPEPCWGEMVVACVVRKENVSLSEDEVISWCRQHIAGYKKPKKVVFCDYLPENANGKVSRPLLRKYLEDYIFKK